MGSLRDVSEVVDQRLWQWLRVGIWGRAWRGMLLLLRCRL